MLILDATVEQAEAGAATEVGAQVGLTQTMSDVGDSYILTQTLALLGFGPDDPEVPDVRPHIPAMLTASVTGVACTAPDGTVHEPDCLTGRRFRVVVRPKNKKDGTPDPFNKQLFFPVRG
jgi:hypothetical protein